MGKEIQLQWEQASAMVRERYKIFWEHNDEKKINFSHYPLNEDREEEKVTQRIATSDTSHINLTITGLNTTNNSKLSFTSWNENEMRKITNKKGC